MFAYLCLNFLNEILYMKLFHVKKPLFMVF